MSKSGPRFRIFDAATGILEFGNHRMLNTFIDRLVHSLRISRIEHVVIRIRNVALIITVVCINAYSCAPRFPSPRRAAHRICSNRVSKLCFRTERAKSCPEHYHKQNDQKAVSTVEQLLPPASFLLVVFFQLGVEDHGCGVISMVVGLVLCFEPNFVIFVSKTKEHSTGYGHDHAE